MDALPRTVAMIERGNTWGEPYDPASGARVVEVAGDDAALAAAVGAHPDAALRFIPDARSDLGRALGIGPARGATVPTRIVGCDLLDLGAGVHAVNAVVLGVAPDHIAWWHRARPVTVEADRRTVGEGRATTVVIASGQYLRGRDLVPRGHPGDGRVEVQVYDVAPGERRALRDRLRLGEHVPHPRIAQASARHVVVSWGGRPAPVEADGHLLAPASGVEIVVRAGRARVLL